MVRLAVTTPIRDFVLPEGICPVKFSSEHTTDIRKFLPELTEISRQMWTYLGYVGLIQPWHDSSDRQMWFKLGEDKLKLFFWTMDGMDVDWRTYCVLSFAMSEYSYWERLQLLLNNKSHWSWVRKLRKHAGSSERLDEVADFLLKFIYLQIETYGHAKIKTSASVKIDTANIVKGKKPTQYFAVYHQIADRISQLTSAGVDYSVWLDEKFQKCKASKVDYIYLSTIVNMNGFDPDLTDMHEATNDEWREIRDFLGLSRRCEFPDGCIPKGWTPAVESTQNPLSIVRVMKDGYYFYADGEQRRGRAHYARNKYLMIKCTPENFKNFKAGWGNPMYLTASPTWAEYSAYAVYPGLWDEKGKSTNERGANIRWGK